jgi:hypothetical protein
MVDCKETEAVHPDPQQGHYHGKVGEEDMLGGSRSGIQLLSHKFRLSERDYSKSHCSVFSL